MPNQLVEPVEVFKALGDASRLRIVELLDQDEASVSDLAVHLRISLPAVLQHLGVLEHVGLISTHKAGRTRRCRLEPAGLGPAEHWLRQRRQVMEAAMDRLGTLLDEPVTMPRRSTACGKP